MDIIQALVTAERLNQAQAEEVQAEVSQGTSTYETALRKVGVPDSLIKNTLAEYYGVPKYNHDSEVAIPNAVLEYVPEESARYYRILPTAINEGVLELASSNPDDLQMRQAMHFISAKHNLPHKFLFALDTELEKYLVAYESLSGEVDEALGSLEDQLEREIAEREKESKTKKDSTADELKHLKEDAPVTKIVATTLRYAVDGGASDIHIEPTVNKVMVRFRVDGILQKSLELPPGVQSAVIARVKILSSIRLDEKRKPQDGRFSATFDGRRIDFRVSILPTNHGEKVVMRILDTSKGVSKLEDTGISSYHLEAIREAIQQPYGIILISGPTGSGKSTTLYAMLSEIDRATKNVLSLEDPVEYDIDGVSQSQMRPEIGYTFASGLRSALRQDPDIIMVGEIRDKETARLAIQAALTGHLVLSTIHTNNSIGVIPRLIDMGVDPYLIAPTLKLAIAQRLARRLYPEKTGKEVTTAGAVDSIVDKAFKGLPKQYLERIPENRTMLSPEPSPVATTGTKGRVAVMEALTIDDKLQALIMNNGTEEEMYTAARKHGFMTIQEDAIIKALQHVISYEEVSTFGLSIALDDEEALEPIAETAQAASLQKANTTPTPVATDTMDTTGQEAAKPTSSTLIKPIGVDNLDTTEQK